MRMEKMRFVTPPWTSRTSRRRGRGRRELSTLILARIQRSELRELRDAEEEELMNSEICIRSQCIILINCFYILNDIESEMNFKCLVLVNHGFIAEMSDSLFLD